LAASSILAPSVSAGLARQIRRDEMIGRKSRKLVVVGLALVAAAAMGVGTAAGANTARAPQTADDAWIQCGYGTVDFELPTDAAPARLTSFAYSLDGGAYQYTRWFYSRGSDHYSFDSASGWGGMGTYAELGVAANTSVRVWEYRLYDNGFAQWDDLGSCLVEGNPFDSGGFVFEHQP
jgi:hypothetical protein